MEALCANPGRRPSVPSLDGGPLCRARGETFLCRIRVKAICARGKEKALCARGKEEALYADSEMKLTCRTQKEALCAELPRRSIVPRRPSVSRSPSVLRKLSVPILRGGPLYPASEEALCVEPEKRHCVPIPAEVPICAGPERRRPVVRGGPLCRAEWWPTVPSIKVRLHYAYKVRILVCCIRDCAVALLRFCGLPTPQNRNGLFTLAWHRTEFDDCLRVIIVRHFEKSDIQFSSLISQHYFRINESFEK